MANGFGFDQILSQAVEALGRPGDLLLSISTSGNSQNVINIIHSAKYIGMKVVGLTWKTDGQMASLCDVEIRAPHYGYSDRIQEIHIKVIHSLVNYIEIGLEEHLKSDETERTDI